jgi:hypothetical protein
MNNLLVISCRNLGVFGTPTCWNRKQLYYDYQLVIIFKLQTSNKIPEYFFTAFSGVIGLHCWLNAARFIYLASMFCKLLTLPSIVLI